jgi:hypothetical protein
LRQPQVKNLGFLWVSYSGCDDDNDILSILMFKLAKSKISKSNNMSVYLKKPSRVNPLDKIFNNLIIPIEDLRLPEMKYTSIKHLKVATWLTHDYYDSRWIKHNSAFDVCGDMLALPDDAGWFF